MPNYTARQQMTDSVYGVSYMFGAEKEGEGTFLRYYRSESTADAPMGAPYTHKLRRNTFEGQKLWMLNDKNMLVGGFLWALWAVYKEALGVSFGTYPLMQYRYAKEGYRRFSERESDADSL